MPDEVQPKAQPWEQREGEPNEAYARFLAYRNMGPARSLDKAYAIHIGHIGNVTKRGKTLQAPGNWAEESAKYHWVERSSLWDVAVLTEVGHAVVVKYVNALEMSFQKIIESLAAGKIKPRTWGQVIESITILGSFIPQETVAEIKQRAGDTVRVEPVKPIGGRIDDQP